MEKARFIDIAVLCQEFSPMEVTCDNSNVTTLDDIEIKQKDFLTLFYPHGQNFGMNKTIANDKRYSPYISFESTYRTVNKKRFFLLECILSNLEADLNIPRTCFTTSSRIDLANEFTNLKTLCDMNCCSVVSSLPWNHVEDIIHNFEIYENGPIVPIFVVSICFKTPTKGVKDNIIRFQYRILKDKDEL